MIHYHGCPISGKEKDQLAFAAKHACISFAGTQNMRLIVELVQSFILDNGAFSAWKSGRKLDMVALEEWLLFWKKHPACDWYLAPDVIDGCEKENDDLLLRFPDGVPVWHLHETLERLERLCSSYSRVAFGSSAEYATVGTTVWWQRMSAAMEVACDKEGFPLCKLHGLRMLNPTVFSHLPFSSADSTNAARNAGIDKAWDKAPYAPASVCTRALIIMERTERHAAAARWAGTYGVKPNMELFG